MRIKGDALRPCVAWLLLAVFVAVLAAYGGKAPLVRVLVPALAALLALPVVLRQDWAIAPDWRLPLLLFLPLIGLALIQLAPWLGHPWQRTVLGQATGAYSLDGGQTWSVLIWQGGCLVFAIAALGAWAGQQRALAQALVLIAAGHALLAIVLGPALPEWPGGVGYAARIRGSFVSPNQAAAYWAAALPLAIHLLFQDRRWLPATLCLVAALACSASRGGILIGALISLPYLASHWRPTLRWRLLPLLILVLVAWLALIGMAHTGARFARMDHDASTLNGRVPIWTGALNLLPSMPWLGTGAGCTEAAWLRAGIADFEPARVEHLHSDALELVFEYGLLGGLVVVLGFASAGFLWHRGRRQNRVSEQGLMLAAGLGLLHLLVHGFVDHLLENEALVLFALLLGVIVIGGRSARRGRAWPPLLLLLIALVLVGAGREWPVAQERQVARQAGTWFTQRVAAGLPISHGRHAEHLQAARAARSSALAWQRARWLNTRAERAAPAAGRRLAAEAQAGLSEALKHAPLQPRLLAEALRSAVLLKRPPAIQATLQTRLMTVAPAWQQGLCLGLLAAQARHDPAAGADCVAALIRCDLPCDPAYAAVAAALLGADALDARLQQAGPRLLAAWRPWLARRGGLATWQKSWAKVPEAPHPLVAAAWSTLFSRPLPVHLPARPDRLAALADQCQAHDLPLPVAWRRALGAAPAPWSAWATAPRWAARNWRQGQLTQLADHRQRPLVARRWAQIERWELVTADPLAARADDDPRLLQHLLLQSSSTAATAHVRALLAVYRQPHWHKAPWGRWTWLACTTEDPAWRRQLDRFQVLIIDGTVHGVRRGLTLLDQATHASPSLHRITLVDAPR